MTISRDLLDDAILCLSRQPETERVRKVRRRLQAVRDGVCDRAEDCPRCPVNCRLTVHVA